MNQVFEIIIIQPNLARDELVFETLVREMILNKRSNLMPKLKYKFCITSSIFYWLFTLS